MLSSLKVILVLLVMMLLPWLPNLARFIVSMLVPSSLSLKKKLVIPRSFPPNKRILAKIHRVISAIILAKSAQWEVSIAALNYLQCARGI